MRFLTLLCVLSSLFSFGQQQDTVKLYHGMSQISQNGERTDFPGEEYILIKEDSIFLISFNGNIPVPIWLSSIEQAHEYNQGHQVGLKIESDSVSDNSWINWRGEKMFCNTTNDDMFELYSNQRRLIFQPLLHLSENIYNKPITEKSTEKPSSRKSLIDRLNYQDFRLIEDNQLIIEGSIQQKSKNNLVTIAQFEGILFLTITTCVTCPILNGFASPVIINSIEEKSITGFRFNNESNLFEPVTYLILPPN